ncbi:hypothetical protein N499_0519A, partial [Wolbachia pipientis wVitA]
MQVNDKKLRA